MSDNNQSSATTIYNLGNGTLLFFLCFSMTQLFVAYAFPAMTLANSVEYADEYGVEHFSNMMGQSNCTTLFHQLNNGTISKNQIDEACLHIINTVMHMTHNKIIDPMANSVLATGITLVMLSMAISVSFYLCIRNQKPDHSRDGFQPI